jgi:hypothetical protein
MNGEVQAVGSLLRAWERARRAWGDVLEGGVESGSDSELVIASVTTAKDVICLFNIGFVETRE